MSDLAKKVPLLVDGTVVGEATLLPGGPSIFMRAPWVEELAYDEERKLRLKNYISLCVEQVGEIVGGIEVGDILGVSKIDSPVDHPKHYNSHPSGVECIDIVRYMNFNLGNVVKYLWRAGLKDQEPEIQDLEKAAWYLNDEIKRRKGQLNA